MTPRCLLYSSDCLHVYQIACQNCSVIIIQVCVCCHSEDAYKPGVLVHSFEKLTPHWAAAFCEIMLLLFANIYVFNKIQKPNLVLVSDCLISFILLNSENFPPAAKETSIIVPSGL